jgi:hypothetical protein
MPGREEITEEDMSLSDDVWRQLVAGAALTARLQGQTVNLEHCRDCAYHANGHCLDTGENIDGGGIACPRIQRVKP